MVSTQNDLMEQLLFYLMEPLLFFFAIVSLCFLYLSVGFGASLGLAVDVDVAASVEVGCEGAPCMVEVDNYEHCSGFGSALALIV